jgi:tRNA(Ile)-lysidine synthase
VLQQFLNHIREKQLFLGTDNILLAVSGGVDSMVMLDLFLKGGFQVGVAHCNFTLRAGESDREQELVEKVCLQHHIRVHTVRFETEEYATQNGLSIQIAARDLRYNFFHTLLQTEGYNYIATAHHAGDNLETVLFNLVRGTGIDGLCGIPIKTGNIIRPLLFATRQDILSYAQEHGLSWMEDSSNHDDHYNRNHIRNNIIPLLKRINPNLEQGFADTVRRISGSRYFSAQQIADFKAASVKETAEEMRIDRGMILKNTYPDVLLWEILKGYDFHFDQVKQMVHDHQTGKVFFSKSHQVVINRNEFIVHALQPNNIPTLTIQRTDTRVVLGNMVLMLEEKALAEHALINDKHVAQMDLTVLSFPLIWRKWKEGDHLIPLGMQGRKKVSDYLIDKKISVFEKEQVTVLESDGEVVWIVGHRISERVKITSSTTKILVITYQASGNDFE